MLEIVPEALFTWAVTGVRGRDFLSNIIPERPARGGRHSNQGGGTNNQGNQPQPQQQGQNGHGGNP